MEGSDKLVSIGKRNPFELFFEISADLLCIAKYDGYFKKVNPAVSKLLGYSEEELLAKPINDFVYEDDKEVTGKARSELVKGNPLFHFENRYVTKSGEIIWLSWTSMYLDSEKIVFAIAKDITHKKRIEEERNAMLINMTKINNELKDLTYTTSHDIRSPIDNLLTIINMMDIAKVTDNATVELITLSKLAGDNLKNTLNTYLDNLAGKEGLKVKLEEVSLGETLKSVILSINSLVKTSNATIKSDFSTLDTVVFNKEYLHSILLNLITNSIKYAKTGCPPVINVSSNKVNQTTGQLILTDNGIGFNMDEIKDKIFGLHQKFHDHYDSKGIGLYLVYNHITSLGGTILLDSKINEGSTFTINFRKGSVS